MLLHPLNGLCEQVRIVQLRKWHVDELRLSSVTLRWHDHLPGKLGRDLGSVVLPDKMKAQVEACGAPGGRHDVSFVHEENARIHRYRRELSCKVIAPAPVRRGTPTI
jgi:hypothetical protein